MGQLRAAGLALIALPAVFAIAPLGGIASGIRSAPDIPAGVVTTAEPQVTSAGDVVVALPDAQFRLIGEGVETGATIDPFTGQSKVPTYIGVDGERITPDRVRRFLDRYRSPMAPFARAIVVAGRRYGVDPRLIVAIAGTESTFGLHQLGYNAWGWDAPHGLTRWPGWEESIEAYTQLFATAYRARDPRVIGPRYCPGCGSWPASTRLFFSLI